MENMYIEKIIEIINIVIENDIDIDHVDDDLTHLGLDSISFIRIIVALEEDFEIEIPDEYLQLSEMNTVKKIEDILMSIKSIS